MMRKFEGNKYEKSQQEYYRIGHRTMYTPLVICIRCTRAIKKTKAAKIRKRCIGNYFLQRACPEHRKLSTVIMRCLKNSSWWLWEMVYSRKTRKEVLGSALSSICKVQNQRYNKFWSIIFKNQTFHIKSTSCHENTQKQIKKENS